MTKGERSRHRNPKPEEENKSQEGLEISKVSEKVCEEKKQDANKYLIDKNEMNPWPHRFGPHL